jgi:hypothetical protein
MSDGNLRMIVAHDKYQTSTYEGWQRMPSMTKSLYKEREQCNMAVQNFILLSTLRMRVSKAFLYFPDQSVKSMQPDFLGSPDMKQRNAVLFLLAQTAPFPKPICDGSSPVVDSAMASGWFCLVPFPRSSTIVFI